MNVWSSLLVMAMLCVPTHLGPLLVPAMRVTVETEGLAQVRTSMLSLLTLDMSVSDKLCQYTCKNTDVVKCLHAYY